MRNTTVHLLFFLVIVAVGFATGISGALWWADRDVRALWLSAGALVVGLIMLLLQAFYIKGSAPPRPEHGTRAPRGRTQRGFEPASGTLVRREPVEADDEETLGPAARALRAYRVE